MNLYLDYINQNSNLSGLRPDDKSIISTDQVKKLNVTVLQYYVYEGVLQHQYDIKK